MKVVVGSRALEYHKLNRTPPKDWDIWYTSEETIEPGIDGMIMPEYIFAELLSFNGYCLPDTVYTIKCSHLGWDIHWEKTKADILWLKHKGCKLNHALYHNLVQHWKELNGNKAFLSLSRDKREFFNDHVTYVYDHDYLHEVVAHPNEPMYKKCLKESEEVLLDKAKFDALPFDDRVRMFREEISTIALERWLVNPKWRGHFTIPQAYSLALKKTIISLTKNWATDFIVTNLDKFYHVDLSYFKQADNIGINKMGDLQVLANLEKSYNDLFGDGRSEFLRIIAHNEFYDETEKWAEELGYELLEQEGGGEGGTEWCYSVFKIDGKIIRLDYNYYSHHGYEFEYAEAKEVKPVEKTITVYE